MADSQALPLERLNSRADFERYAEQATTRWNALWDGDLTVVSVGVGSSSIAQGALDVLAACEAYARGQQIRVRQVGVDGADWMEVQVQVKRAGQPAVSYGKVVPSDIPGVISGSLQEKAIGVAGSESLGSIPPLSSHPFYRHQQRLVLADTGVIDPDSIEEAVARGAYSAYLKVLFDMAPEEAIAEMTAAVLRGRGGAGFPAGIKW
jgi:NADH-quinone oxidoreductase subunit F